MVQLDLQKLDLRKNIVLDLVKRNNIEGVVAKVILALDYSLSMSDEYRSGLCQDVVERILPLGLQFDDNKEVDFYLFHDSYIKLQEPLTLSSTAGYINSKVIGKYNMGGTDYASVINAIVNDSVGITVKSIVKNLFGSFFGGSSKEETKDVVIPTYVIFITDGDTSNKSGVEKAIRDASGKPVFWSIVGIGNERFSFLEGLDNLSNRVLDNVSFFKVKDIKKMTDDELYANLMSEFPSWITKAKAKGIL